MGSYYVGYLWSPLIQTQDKYTTSEESQCQYESIPKVSWVAGPNKTHSPASCVHFSENKNLRIILHYLHAEVLRAWSYISGWKQFSNKRRRNGAHIGGEQSVGLLVSTPLFTRLGRRAPRHLPADYPVPLANARGSPHPQTERPEESREPKDVGIYGQLKRCAVSFCCKLWTRQSGIGCVSCFILFIYVCKNGDLFALSYCTNNLRVFRGSIFFSLLCGWWVEIKCFVWCYCDFVFSYYGGLYIDCSIESIAFVSWFVVELLLLT